MVRPRRTVWVLAFVACVFGVSAAQEIEDVGPVSVPLRLVPMERHQVPGQFGARVVGRGPDVTRIPLRLVVTRYECEGLDISAAGRKTWQGSIRCYELLSDSVFSWATWCTERMYNVKLQEDGTGRQFLTGTVRQNLFLREVAGPRDRCVAFWQDLRPGVKSSAWVVPFYSFVPDPRELPDQELTAELLFGRPEIIAVSGLPSGELSVDVRRPGDRHIYSLVGKEQTWELVRIEMSSGPVATTRASVGDSLGLDAEGLNGLQRKVAELFSYHFRADLTAKAGTVVHGEFTGWADGSGTVEQWQRGDRYLRTKTTRGQGIALTPEGSHVGRTSTLTIVTPNIGWMYLDPQAEAYRIDFAQQVENAGVESVRNSLTQWRLEHDPVAWLLLMDPATVEVGAEPVMPQLDESGQPVGGDVPIQFRTVLEGKPVKGLLANADRMDRDKLPIEPLLRVTVGEDGFPRHVLVQCYCPKWDVLELTVTDYTLNPDLADDLFQFTPPPGVKVIEADPSNWK